MSAERNLLFGVLAVQTELISRKALVEGMNTCASEKQASLADRLERTGVLAAEDRAMVESLVAKHLSRHQEDPLQTLAALSAVEAVREDLEQISDPDIQQSLTHLSVRPSRDPQATMHAAEDGPPPQDPYATYRLAEAGSAAPAVGAGTQARDLFPTVPNAGKDLRASQTSSDNSSKTNSSRFDVLRLHAKGGLGEVFVANDLELNRQVALKQIQAHHADDPSCQSRFMAEARITGGLEHPGIVPVYALGRYYDGQPYYAMRLIKGHSLQAAIERFYCPSETGQLSLSAGERNVELRQLLGRFVDVCQAVAYAHSRGVLHRDLKPGNIMLGDYGETLVVDWGLAKRLRISNDSSQGESTEAMLPPVSPDDSGATAVGQVIGTPAFMSPEQAASRLDDLSPRSDVYSLGATLYSLLTGRPPVKAENVATVLERVQRGEFPLPRQVRSDVPKALEAICLKAMSLAPENRYASAKDLAADIEHWLADEPVTAYSEPAWLRGARWMRRHRIVVVGVAALLLAAVPLLGVLVVNREEARRRAEVDKLEITRQNGIVAAERDAKEAALKVEEQQRKYAQAIAEFVRDDFLALTSEEGQERFGGEAKEGLAKLTTLRQLLDRAATKLNARKDLPPEIEADLRWMIGVNYRAQGEAALALPYLEHCLTLRTESLGAKDPQTLNAQNSLAVAYRNAGKYEQAIALHEENVKLSQEVHGADNPHTITRMGNLAATYWFAGKLKLALPLFEENLRLRRTILGPDHPDTLLLISVLATVYRKAGKHDLALRLYEEGLKLTKAKLGSHHPDTVKCMRSLSLGQLTVKKPDLALLEECLKLTRDQFGPYDPKTLECMNNLASGYQLTGKLNLALPLFEESLKLHEEKVGAYHSDTLVTMNNLAQTYQALGKLSLAVPLMEKTVKLRKEKIGPEDPETHSSMVNLATAYVAAGKREQALALLEEAAAAVEKQYYRPQHSDRIVTNLINCLELLKHYDRAEQWRRKWLAMLKELGEGDSMEYARRLSLLGANLIKQQKWSDAEGVLRECLAICEKRQPKDWGTFAIQSMLGGTLSNQKKFAEAEPQLLQALQGLKAPTAKLPPQAKTYVTETLERLVALYQATGQAGEATKWSKELSAVKK